MEGLDETPFTMFRGVLTALEPLVLSAPSSVDVVTLGQHGEVAGAGEGVTLNSALTAAGDGRVVIGAAPSAALTVGGSVVVGDEVTLRATNLSASLCASLLPGAVEVGGERALEFGTEVTFGRGGTVPATTLPVAAVVRGDVFVSGAVLHGGGEGGGGAMTEGIATTEMPAHEAVLRGVRGGVWTYHTFVADAETRVGVVRIVQRGVRARRSLLGVPVPATIHVRMKVAGHEAAVVDVADVALTDALEGFDVPAYVREDGLEDGMSHCWPLEDGLADAEGAVELVVAGEASFPTPALPAPPVGRGCVEISKLCSVRTSAPLPTASAGWSVCMWYCCVRRTTGGGMASPILSAGTSSQAPMSCFRLYRHGSGFGLTTDVYGRNAVVHTDGVDLGRWYHLAVCRRGADLLLFVDSHLVGSTPAPASPDAFVAAPTVVGGMCDFYRMCDLRFYAKPLDATALERFHVFRPQPMASAATIVVSPAAVFSAGEVVEVAVRYAGRALDPVLPKVDVKLYPASVDRFGAVPPPPLLLHESVPPAAVARYADVAGAMDETWQVVPDHRAWLSTPLAAAVGREDVAGGAKLHVAGDASFPGEVVAALSPSSGASPLHPNDAPLLPPVTAALPLHALWTEVGRIPPLSSSRLVDCVVVAYEGPWREGATFTVTVAAGDRAAAYVECPLRAPPAAVLSPPAAVPASLCPGAKHHWPLAGDLDDRAAAVPFLPCGVSWLRGEGAARVHDAAADISDVGLVTSATVSFHLPTWTLLFWMLPPPAGAEGVAVVTCDFFSVSLNHGWVGVSPSPPSSPPTPEASLPFTPGVWTLVAVSRNVHSIISLRALPSLTTASAQLWLPAVSFSRSRLRLGPCAAPVAVQEVAFFERSLSASDLAACAATAAAPNMNAAATFPIPTPLIVAPGDEVSVQIAARGLTGVGRVTVSLHTSDDNPAENHGGGVLREAAVDPPMSLASLSVPVPRAAGHVASMTYVDRHWSRWPAPATVGGALEVAEGGAVSAAGDVHVGGAIVLSSPSLSPANAASLAYVREVMRWSAMSGEHVGAPLVADAGGAMAAPAGGAAAADLAVLKNTHVLATITSAMHVRPFLTLRSFGDGEGGAAGLDFTHWLGVVDRGGEGWAVGSLSASFALAEGGDASFATADAANLDNGDGTVTLRGEDGAVFGRLEAAALVLRASSTAADDSLLPFAAGVGLQSSGHVMARLSPTAQDDGECVLFGGGGVANTAPWLSFVGGLPDGTRILAPPSGEADVVSVQGFLSIRRAGWTAAPGGHAVRGGKVVVGGGAGAAAGAGGAALNVLGDLAVTSGGLRLRGVEQRVGWWSQGDDGGGSAAPDVTWVERMQVSPAVAPMGVYAVACDAPLLAAGGVLACTAVPGSHGSSGLRLWTAADEAWKVVCDGGNVAITSGGASGEGVIFENASDAMLLSIRADSGDVVTSSSVSISSSRSPNGTSVVGGDVIAAGDVTVGGDVADGSGRSLFQTFVAQRGAWGTTDGSIHSGARVTVGAAAGEGGAALTVAGDVRVASSLAPTVVLHANDNASGASTAMSCVSLSRAAKSCDFGLVVDNGAGARRPSPSSPLLPVTRVGDAILSLSAVAPFLISSSCTIGAGEAVMGAPTRATKHVVVRGGVVGSVLPPLSLLHVPAGSGATLGWIDGGGAAGRAEGTVAQEDGGVALAALSAGGVLSSDGSGVQMSSLTVSGAATIGGDVEVMHLAVTPAAMSLADALAAAAPPSAPDHPATMAFAQGAVGAFSSSGLWLRQGSSISPSAASHVAVGHTPTSAPREELRVEGDAIVSGEVRAADVVIGGAKVASAWPFGGAAHRGALTVAAADLRPTLPPLPPSSEWSAPLGVASSSSSGVIVVLSAERTSVSRPSGAPSSPLPGRVFPMLQYCPVLKLFACFSAEESTLAPGGFVPGQPRRCELYVSHDGETWQRRPLRLRTFSASSPWSAENPKYGQLATVDVFQAVPGGGFAVAGTASIRPTHSPSTWHLGYHTRDGLLWEPVRSASPHETSISCFGSGGTAASGDRNEIISPSLAALPHPARVFVTTPGGTEVVALNSRIFSVLGAPLRTFQFPGTAEGEARGVWYVGGTPFVLCDTHLYRVGDLPSAPFVAWELVARTPHVASVVQEADGGIVMVLSGGRGVARIPFAASSSARLGVCGELEVGGDLFCPAPVATISDARFKTDVRALERDAASLPRAYGYMLRGERSVGFVAQEVPEAMRREEGEGGVQTVDYDRAIPMIAAAIKRLLLRVHR